MQAKQQALLKQVDALDEECEELQGQLAESEERQTSLHQQLHHALEERDQVKAQLSQQQVRLSSRPPITTVLKPTPPTGLCPFCPVRITWTLDVHRRPVTYIKTP